MNKILFTKIFSASLIVMLALGAMPVTPAYAAAAELNAWTLASSSNPAANNATIAAGNLTVSAGTNRLFIGAYCLELSGANTMTTMGMSLGGTALTQIQTTGGTNMTEHCWMGYLLESQIPAGSNALTAPYNINGGGTTATGAHVYWASYSGISQTTPINDSNQNSNGATNVTFGAQIDYVLDGVTFYIAGNIGSPTVTMTAPAGPPAFSQQLVTTSNNHATFIGRISSVPHSANGNYGAATNIAFAGASAGARSSMVVASLRPLNTATTTGTAIATAASNSSIDVSMPYTNDDDGDNTYTIEYKPSASGTWLTFVSGATHTASPYNNTVTGLLPNTSYDVRVTWTDTDGVNGTNPQTINGITTPWCGPSLTYTIPAGNNRVLVVIVSNEQGTNPSNVQVDAAAINTIATVSQGNARIFAGYQVLGSSASAQTVNITATNGDCFYANTYTDINQTVGVGTSNTINSFATGTSPGSTTGTTADDATTTSAVVTNAAGGRVIYAINMNNGSADGQVPTATSTAWTFTELFDAFEANGGNRTGVGESSTTVSGSATITVPAPTPNHNRAALIAFALNPLLAQTASVTNSPQTYNGSPQSAAVTCSGGGVASDLQYNSSATIPTNAGTYAVTADCPAAPGYSAGNDLTAGNFVINPINQTASVTNSPQNYTGAAQAATVSCSGGGVATNISTGGAANQTDAGTYAVTADCPAVAPNYNAGTALAAGNFVINPINQTASVTNSPQSYTGAAQSATVSCSGGGVATNISTGGAANQTDAGTYAVTADCPAVAPNYNASNGLAAGNFVINPINQTASVTNSPQSYTGAAQSATVSCSGGGVATNISTGGAASQTDAGTYAVMADCPAVAPNYNAGTALAAGNFVINPINQTASVTNSPQSYTGAAQSATVSCSGGGVATNISTGGAANQTDAGTYAVTADCPAVAPNYNASNGLAAGNFVINPINQTASVTNSPQSYTGAAQSATVSCSGGGVATNISTGGAASQTDAGTYAVMADCPAVAPNYNASNGLAAGNFVINPINQTASVTNSPQNYTGAAQSATVSCSGGGVATNISTGGAASQTNAGTYAVTADCPAAAPNYNAVTGVAAGNFVINQIAPTASITNSPVIYNGALQTAAVACLGGGTATIATGGSGTNVGSYPTTVDCAASLNYTAATGLAAGNFVIDPATPTASITNSPVIYNGALQTAVVACSGGGTATIATGGSGTNVGSYPTTVDCAASLNYTAATGLAAGNFVIDRSSQTITVTTSAPVAAVNGSSFNVVATASSGLPVTISVSGICTVADLDGSITDGDATVTMTSGTGTCSVFYDQAGDANFNPAPQVQEDVTATDSPVITSANNASFDLGFVGTFNITATGNPSTMVISVSGTLPSGITLTDNGNGTASFSGTPAAGTAGVYNLILTANNGVNPNGTQNFTLTVRNGPVVGVINSSPDTGDGNVAENETVANTLGITQLTVEFNRDVYDVPASTTDPDEVDNPANYILVRSTTGTFNTLSCAGGVVAPDIITPVTSVTYSNGGGSGPFVATVTLSTPITTDGYYRLFVCGTTSIVDAVNTGLILAGDGTTPGTDFIRNFQLVTPAAGGGGGGGGGARDDAKLAVAALPATGFAPGRITKLPVQPDELAYSDLGEMWIEIPSLGIKTSIVGVPQTAEGEWDVTWLANNVGWLNGTAFPTWEGNSVVTAHVTNADGVDGPFSNLKKLKYGDQIIIHLYGQKYIFEVRNSRLSRPFTTSFAFENLEDASYLTLITCQTYLPKSDTYMHRRVIRAVLISVENE